MKGKDKTPLLTIIIPVYNTEKYISECLDSIINNDYNLEIILVDDGSTDNSKNICINYSKKDSRIKFYSQKNLGVSAARNLGIDKCIGKYIMFVDSDDKLKDNWVNIVFPLLHNNDFDCMYIQNFKKVIQNNVTKEKLVTYILGQNLEGISLKGPWSKIYKTSFIKEKNIRFNSELSRGEDILFNILAVYYMDKFLMKKNSFYLYRKNNNSLTKTYSEKKEYVLKEYYKYLKLILKKFDFNSNMINQLLSGAEKNIFFINIGNISFIKNYFIAKKEYKRLYNNEKVILDKSRLKKSEKVIYFLWNHKLFFLLHFIWKIVRIIKTKIQKVKCIIYKETDIFSSI